MEKESRTETSILPTAELLRIVSELQLAHAMAKEYREEAKKYKDLSERNAVTGLANDRGFITYIERLQKEFARKGGGNGKYIVVVGDIRHFKDINDSISDSAGDTVLRAVADYIDSHARPEDFVGNPFGDTFMMVLPTDSLKAKLAVEGRLLYGISNLKVDVGGGQIVSPQFKVKSTVVAIDTDPREMIAEIRSKKYTSPRGRP